MSAEGAPPLGKNDRITTLIPIGKVAWLPVYGLVTNASVTPGLFGWRTTWSYSGTIDEADEGIRWIRGWHDLDGAEVQSLQAANALAESATSSQEPPVVIPIGNLHDLVEKM